MVGEMLRWLNISLVALYFFGNFVTEVNSSAPTSVTNISEITHRQSSPSKNTAAIFEEIETFSNNTEISPGNTKTLESFENSSFTYAENPAVSTDFNLYNLSEGPLECSKSWPYLNRRDTSVCTEEWPPGSLLPRVICGLVGGYKPIAGTFSTLMYGIATYQLTDTMVGNMSNEAVGSQTNTWTGWCAYQSRYEMRRVKSLPKGVPVVEDTVLVESTSSGEKTGQDQILVFISQGLQHIVYDYGPASIGATAALLTQDDCPTCPAELWNVEFEREANLIDIYLNAAWRIQLEFLPAYISLATTMLGLLNHGSLVEEMKIGGGQHWHDPVLFKAELQYLKILDLSGNGISSLQEVNFVRTPNLHHLNLSKNNLTVVPNGIRFLKHLQTLDVSYNPFKTTLFAAILRPLNQLKVINVSAVPLFSLHHFAPEEDISETRTQEMNMYSKLEELDVSDCNISNVNTSGARRLFKMLRNLRVLRLSGNPLTEVPHDLAEHLPALQELYLSRCRLRSPPALRLAPAQRLQLLDLSRNLLATPEGALAPLAAGGGVDLLDVSGNPLLQGWEANAFAPLGPNATLNLSRTELSIVTRSMLEALQPLRTVDLGGNPFDCSLCSIYELRQWLKNGTRPEVLSLGKRKPVECVLPPSESGRAVRDVAGPPSAECPEGATAGEGAWMTVVGASAAVALLTAGALVLLAFRFRLQLTYVLHVIRANRSISRYSRESDRHEFDAFVCYSKHDRSWVLGELLPRLEGDNPRYRLCLHERDFPLGSLIVQNIVECMARSRRTLMVLTKAFVDSQWCQWELEMATHRLLEGVGSDFLVLVELEPLESRSLPRLLRLLVETRTFLQWPSALTRGCCRGGLEGEEEAAWRRLRAALGPPLCHAISPQSSSTSVLPFSANVHTLPSGEDISLSNLSERDCLDIKSS